MSRFDSAFEIHVHGQVPLRDDVRFVDLQDALQPLWKYSGARSLEEGAASRYQDETGIRFDVQDHYLQMCWTVAGDEDFRQVIEDVCMNLNEIAAAGAAIEVTFYDAEYEDDADAPSRARDDFLILFVGPTPTAIMQVQRDILVQDVVNLMERHFDGAELGGLVTEIDKLFSKRFDSLVSSLDLGRPMGGANGGTGPGRGPGRKPRHLH